MTDGAAEVERRRPVAAAALALSWFALAGAAWLVARGLLMQFILSPTPENVEKATAGRWLVGLGVAAASLAAAGMLIFRRLRIGLAVLSLLLVPTGEIWASRQTSPSPSTVAHIEAFHAPDSFGDSSFSGRGSTGPLERRWTVGSSIGVDTVCEELEAAVVEWADPGSVSRDPNIRPCYMTATRNGGAAFAQVVEFEGALSVLLSHTPQ